MRPRMLVVEDDEQTIHFMEIWLASLGRCDVARDGITAIDLFSKALGAGDPYHYMLLDIGLPGIDGLKVLNLLRTLERNFKVEKDKHCRVIITTGQRDAKSMQEAFNQYCDAYLMKPIGPTELTGVFKKIGYKQLEDE